ncbi:histidinol-phosphate aminotransferase [Metschnikowia bicuspidata var. bicuspidata NRRL YB-4993]|uniref:histidinol-phosphate transaminase n=1 Tax=Metschnikowia bicuspidata var. bicuspidata NRRL YB-4993 TaxID=869754 RepID=A0A1A0HDZ4_9ASCO|nr:histidinol-phosphate aminotransferase [Metschnikowia bicuspidata var. bicuspidata NRRL YB-4993]OBA22319.1 histidinol-phosphate aminotransferase [Metschnikowia bicuspidata var. bicuspidata NRRL YB-4993]
MTFDLQSLVRPNIAKLEPYRCARDDFKEGILLDANENTHGPALETVSSYEAALELNRYPDPHQMALKQQIVAFRSAQNSRHLADPQTHGLVPENLCLGVGSDESIDLLLRCVCVPGKDKLLVCPPTYGMYSICAAVNDVALVRVPLTAPGFQLDSDAVLHAVTQDPAIKLMYLTSPGNPTGQLLQVAAILALVAKLRGVWNGLVVVDEAYIDFASEEDGSSPSVSTLVNQHPNLVVMQTLSKSFGLAGIRLGITYACRELAHYLNAMKYPYNISSLTSAVAMRSTCPDTGLQVMERYVALILRERALLLLRLQELEGVGRNLGGLDANFLLVEILDKDGQPSNAVAHAAYTKLAVDNAVVVRFRGKELNCTGGLRISVGTQEENRELLERFAKCLVEARQ